MLCTVVLLYARSDFYVSLSTLRHESKRFRDRRGLLVATDWRRPGSFLIPIFNKLVSELIAKNTNRKTGKCKTLWFIYIKILVCHFTYIYIYVQLYLC